MALLESYIVEVIYDIVYKITRDARVPQNKLERDCILTIDLSVIIPALHFVSDRLPLCLCHSC